MKEYCFEIPFFFSEPETSGFTYWKEKHKEVTALENLVLEKFSEVWNVYSKYPSLWYELVISDGETYKWEIYKKKDIVKKTFSESFYKGKVIATITIKIISKKK